MYYCSSKEMKRLDDLAVKNGVSILQMMELAGYHMVSVFRKLHIPKTKKIVILVGVGNKGGDGLSAARHLINHGWSHISIIHIRKSTTKPSTHHRRLLEKMKVEMFYYTKKKQNEIQELISNSDVIIDSLIGYQLKGVPRGIAAELILLAEAAKKYTIAIDMPSGIDATDGTIYEPHISARATLTFALPKKLFLKKEAGKLSGTIFLGDIGIPGNLYDQIKKGSRPSFNFSGIIQL